MDIKKENLEEKLEQINPIKTESASHKESLKKTLIDWKYGKKEKQWGLLPLFAPKSLVLSLSGAAFILLIFLAINVAIRPQLSLAEVRNIALKDYAIQKLISEGNKIQDIKIVDKKGYVLITNIERIYEPAQVISTGSIKNTERKITVLAEISFEDKRVVDIKNLSAVNVSLTEEQKTEATKIFMDSQVSENTTSENKIEIQSVTSAPVSSSQLQLTPKNGGVEISPVEEKAIIIYESNGQQKEAEINITNQQVESTATIEQGK